VSGCPSPTLCHFVTCMPLVHPIAHSSGSYSDRLRLDWSVGRWRGKHPGLPHRIYAKDLSHEVGHIGNASAFASGGQAALTICFAAWLGLLKWLSPTDFWLAIPFGEREGGFRFQKADSRSLLVIPWNELNTAFF